MFFGLLPTLSLFFMKKSTFCDLENLTGSTGARSVSSCIRIGLAPWTRIRIETKADPHRDNIARILTRPNSLLFSSKNFGILVQIGCADKKI